jgi:hypothetical protein
MRASDFLAVEQIETEGCPLAKWLNQCLSLTKMTSLITKDHALFVIEKLSATFLIVLMVRD